MNKKLRFPLLRSRIKTNHIMLDVFIALLPALCWSFYIYGLRPFVILVISVASCGSFEYLYNRFLLKKQNTPVNFSFAVTGVLTAFAMPPSVPLWLPVFAALASTVVAKMAFGGLGKNIFNPAAFGVCASYICYKEWMTAYIEPFTKLSPFALSINSGIIDNIRIITPLAMMKDSIVQPSAIADQFYGISTGGIGELSVLLLLLGFIYLIFKKITKINTAFAYIMTIVVITFFTCHADCEPVEFMMMQLFTGGVFLIAVFMLSDYATTPATSGGKIMFAIICGGLTVGFRYYGITYYGEYFAVLITNGLTPLLEKITLPRVFGAAVRSGQND